MDIVKIKLMLGVYKEKGLIAVDLLAVTLIGLVWFDAEERVGGGVVLEPDLECLSRIFRALLRSHQVILAIEMLEDYVLPEEDLLTKF